ncbi:MAG: hypothetical protein JWN70_2718 [Planctomycetaceae bacterium]|nr:hypothetical protein [Planctomycetaceae bacterium]
MRRGRYSRDAQGCGLVIAVLCTVVVGACYVAYRLCCVIGVILRALGIHLYAMGRLYWGMLIGLRGDRAVQAATAPDPAGVAAGLALRRAVATVGSSISAVGWALLSAIIVAGQRVDRVIRSLAGKDMFMVWFVRSLLALLVLFVQGVIFYRLDLWIFSAK